MADEKYIRTPIETKEGLIGFGIILMDPQKGVLGFGIRYQVAGRLEKLMEELRS